MGTHCPQCGVPAAGPARRSGLVAGVVVCALGGAALVFVPVLGLLAGPLLMLGAVALAAGRRPARRCAGCGYSFPASGDIARWLAVILLTALTAATVVYAFSALPHGR